jgi:hypothetical protein
MRHFVLKASGCQIILQFANLILFRCAATLSTLVACSYRKEYFKNATEKPIAFYDMEENSSGTYVLNIVVKVSVTDSKLLKIDE